MSAKFGTKWQSLLTNQPALLCVLLFVSAIPILLNSAFPFSSAVDSLNQSIVIYCWLLLLWIIAVATQLNLFGAKQHAHLFVCVAVAIAVAHFLYIFWIKTLYFTDIGREFELGSAVIVLCVLYSSAAMIADRISDSLLVRVGAFFGVLNWPIFLFMFADRLRKEMRDAAESSLPAN